MTELNKDLLKHKLTKHEKFLLKSLNKIVSDSHISGIIQNIKIQK